MVRRRIDQLLVDRGLCHSREQAKRSIMAGLVYSGERRMEKPGTTVDVRSDLELRGCHCPYVSRGGLKLAKALTVFPVSVTGKVAVDIGASTGGFTDCLLQHGASRVYAVDVGYGQLDWRLRTDSRVTVMERTNARHLTNKDFEDLADLATIDVAFISITKFFANLLDLLTENGEIIALIKPQFEAGRQHVGKKGVVRDLYVHQQLLVALLQELQDCGVGLKGLDFSPLKGREGNVEYLAYLQKGSSSVEVSGFCQRVVENVRDNPPTMEKDLR